MFETADLNHKVSDQLYRKEEPALRAALLAAQQRMRAQGLPPLLILIAGVEGAGKGETVNLLNEWMDPRFVEVTGFGPPSDEERDRPPMWRFWRALPPTGKIGVFFGAWHTLPILQRVQGNLKSAEFGDDIEQIVRFERMLADEGVVLVKYWFHISKAQQKARLEKLEKNPKTRWRVTKADWRLLKMYEKFVGVTEPFIRKTSTDVAPWTIVPGADPNYRALFVGRHLLGILNEQAAQKLKPAPKAKPKRAVALTPDVDHLNLIRALKLDQAYDRKSYDRDLEKWQGRLATALRQDQARNLGVVAVFEGNDAAGKGGAIRRLTQALDARTYRTVPIAAPTDEERAHPYLWRFWRQLPRKGQLTIFDRSWYGRVLVERVEGFAPEADWQRAYSEINEFEAQMAGANLVVVKFWLAISKDEQLRRFKEREKIAFKRFKITAEDWRNRKRWDDYEQAVCDMVDRTSTSSAPWTLVEANNKYFARIKVLKTLVKAIDKALDKN